MSSRKLRANSSRKIISCYTDENNSTTWIVTGMIYVCVYVCSPISIGTIQFSALPNFSDRNIYWRTITSKPLGVISRVRVTTRKQSFRWRINLLKISYVYSTNIFNYSNNKSGDFMADIYLTQTFPVWDFYTNAHFSSFANVEVYFYSILDIF